MDLAAAKTIEKLSREMEKAVTSNRTSPIYYPKRHTKISYRAQQRAAKRRRRRK